MKVWECNGCRDNCIVANNSNCPGPVHCAWTTEYNETCNWHETTRYEITERKPDYKAMAERGQIGRNGEGILCRLVNYLPAMTTSFEVQYFGEKGAHLTPVFTPCAEPVELDPITMEAKND